MAFEFYLVWCDKVSPDCAMNNRCYHFKVVFRPGACYDASAFRRGGRVVEGAPLLREYGGNLIEGSNPSLSAKVLCARSSVG